MVYALGEGEEEQEDHAIGDRGHEGMFVAVFGDLGEDELNGSDAETQDRDGQREEAQERAEARRRRGGGGGSRRMSSRLRM